MSSNYQNESISSPYDEDQQQQDAACPPEKKSENAMPSTSIESSNIQKPKDQNDAVSNEERTSTQMSNKVRNKEAKRKETTEFSCEEAFMIGILSLVGVGFVIAKKKKTSTKSKQFLNIVEVKGKVTMTEQQMKTKIEQFAIREEDSSIKKGYNRNCQKNERTAIFNLLRDAMVFVFGRNNIEFSDKLTRQPSITVKKRTFSEVKIGYITFRYQNNIMRIGSEIHQLITNRFLEQKKKLINEKLCAFVEIDPYDEEITNYFSQYDLKPNSFDKYWVPDSVLRKAIEKK